MPAFLARLAGLVLALAASALLAWLAQVSYGEMSRFSSAAIRLGLPMFFLLVLAGGWTLIGGLVLLFRRRARRRASGGRA